LFETKVLLESDHLFEQTQLILLACMEITKPHSECCCHKELLNGFISFSVVDYGPELIRKQHLENVTSFCHGCNLDSL